VKTPPIPRLFPLPFRNIEDDRKSRLESEIFIQEGVDPSALQIMMSATPQKLIGGIMTEKINSTFTEKV